MTSLQNKRIYTAACFLMIFLLPVTQMFSADNGPSSGPGEPSETEIILPEMYLEIEDLSIEEINAVIPDDDAVLLSSLELPLPEPGQIEIPAEVFAVTDSGAPTSISAGTGAQSASFFSEGTIGAGTAANITGDINLYHIGEQPDFRLRYFHDSYDGFAGHEAGEGYSAREELIEAELNYDDEKLSADATVSYSELETGLQGQTDYFSMTRRIPTLTSDIEWMLLDKLKLTGSIDAGTAGLQLNSVLVPLGFRTFNIAPEAGIVFGSDKLNIGAKLNYDVSGELGGSIVQGLGGGLFFTVEPAEIFRLYAEADLLWDNYSQLYFPFEVEMSGTASSFNYSIGGGYKSYYTDWNDLWDILPAAGGPQNTDSLGSMPLTHGWYGEGGFRWNLTDRFALSFSTDFSAFTNVLIPEASTLTGFYSFRTEDAVWLSTGAGFNWKMFDNLTLNASWEGQLLEQYNLYLPRHLFTSGLELTSEDRDMGIIGDLEFRIYDESAQSWYTNDWIPYIGLEAYMRIADGFVLSVSGSDLAAGILSSGRNAWKVSADSAYLDKGTTLQAKIKISL